MGRKKKPETLKKEYAKLEKDVKNMEEYLKKKNEEKNLSESIQQKQEYIRNDLMNQLHEQGKFGKHFEDLIDDYLYYVELKELVKYDLKVNGIRYKNTGGNGFTTFKPNESVTNLPKISTVMMKILDDLGLKEPDENGGDEGDDLL